MNNLHIVLNDFEHGSRVLKETKSLVSNNRVDYVFIAAFGAKSLAEWERLDDQREINRISLSTRKLPKTIFFQVIKYIEFVFKVIFRYRTQNIGIVNCHSLASLPIGLVMKLLYGSKLVYDAHELETERKGLHGVPKRMSKILERFAIKYIDLTIVVGHSIADHYQDNYDMERPVVVLNCPEYRKVAGQNIFREELKISEHQRIFLYQGNLMKGRSIEFLCDTFAGLTDNENVIVFMGYGDLDQYIQSIAEKNKNVFFYPAVAPDTVLNYTSSADVGICLIEPICLSYYFSLPNKLFEYMMGGLPLIVLNSYEQEKLISSENLGIVLQELTEKSIKDAIKKIKPKRYYKANIDRMISIYNWTAQEKVMIAAYDKMLSQTPT